MLHSVVFAATWLLPRRSYQRTLRRWPEMCRSWSTYCQGPGEEREREKEQISFSRQSTDSYKSHSSSLWISFFLHLRIEQKPCCTHAVSPWRSCAAFQSWPCLRPWSHCLDGWRSSPSWPQGRMESEMKCQTAILKCIISKLFLLPRKN